jgi:hypothetical protein
MLTTIERSVAAPVTISAEQALALSRDRFPNLASTGILGRSSMGPPIDPDHVTIALMFLAWCRKTKIPRMHSSDLRRRIGDVSLGAVIAAAVGLNFEVRSWSGVTDYAPHALMNVNPSDVRRMADSDHDDDRRTGRPATGNLSRTR